jgi:RND family efflux transporter MFP subunit
MGLMFLVALTACKKAKPPGEKPLESVIVERPISEPVTDYEDFTGHTEAFAAVDLRAQVTGYLKEIRFKDGDDVKAGDPLFTIDPELFEAEFERATAALDQAQQTLAKARDLDHRNQTSGVAVSEADKVTSRLDLKLNEAAVAAARAQLKTAKKNLEFTHIVAPITGRLSRRQIDPGNLVKANDTLLTSIVTQDPIYASFDVDERTWLKLRRLMTEGIIPTTSATGHKVEVKIGLADEEGFSLTGVIDFAENKIDPGTGTIRLRAILRNRNLLYNPVLSISGTGLANAPMLTSSKNMFLSAGQFVRFRLPLGKPEMKILIPEDAIGSDQGNKYIFIVKPTGETKVIKRDNKDVSVDIGRAQRRDIKQGSLVDKEMYTSAGVSRIVKFRVVEVGLEKDELVVVDGIQRVRDKRDLIYTMRKP